MRKPIIIGNWKMNMSLADSLLFLQELDKIPFKIDVGIAPQYLALPAMLNAKASSVLLGAQNAHESLSGAYTGEVSVALLKEIKADFCIVGHSERRQYYNETDGKVNLKAKQLLAHDITPVICVGETLSQFENEETAQVIREQVEVTCANLEIDRCVIAYEPVWAIGTGKTATSQIAQDICHLIREILTEMYSKELATKVRIQYGGSVNPENIVELMNCPDIDGALVGGASLDLTKFEKLITY